MSQIVQLKRSSVVGHSPSAEDMRYGELYVNFASGYGNSYITTKKFDGTIAEFREKEYLVISGTTEEWNRAQNFTPGLGQMVIYTDGGSYTDASGVTTNYPRIKIGTGNAYVQDLNFINEDIILKVESHIGDTNLHIQEGEREFWNHKLDISGETITNETLVFTRENMSNN